MESKRTERLASALYLLTSFFDEKEPMRWKLRELANKLVGQNDNQKNVLEISKLLNIAKTAGLVSETNHSIIDKEIANLLPQNNLENLFVSEKIPERISENIPRERAKQSNIYLGSSVTATRPKVIKDKTVGVVAIKKNSRQNTIVSLLKKKGEIMIKDVSPLIQGVSEKTIQRELLAMVKAQILRKTGEKRWSRYSLIEGSTSLALE